MRVREAKKLLKASYRKNHKNYGDYEIDKSLSGNRVQVYKKRNTNEAVVVHRGTANMKDWITDAGMALGYESGKRFKHSEKIQNKAIEKYGKDNITTMGHSLGGRLAEKYHRGGGKIITVNKAATPRSILRVVPKNQIDIRNKNDPVSYLSKYQKYKVNPIITDTKTINPIKSHKLSTMNPIIEMKL